MPAPKDTRSHRARGSARLNGRFDAEWKFLLCCVICNHRGAPRGIRPPIQYPIRPVGQYHSGIRRQHHHPVTNPFRPCAAYALECLFGRGKFVQSAIPAEPYHTIELDAVGSGGFPMGLSLILAFQTGANFLLQASHSIPSR